MFSHDEILYGERLTVQSTDLGFYVTVLLSVNWGKN
jgi:hypothetical protein